MAVAHENFSSSFKIGLTGNNNELCEFIALALVNVIIMSFCAFTT